MKSHLLFKKLIKVVLFATLFYSPFILYAQVPVVTTVGDSFKTDNAFTLTKDEPHVSGAIRGMSRIDLSSNFTLRASLYFGNKDAGAEGIAFVLQKSFLTSNDSPGIGLGYESITPSLSVEFDTHYNLGSDPTSKDHVALIKDGNVNSETAHSQFVSFFDKNELEDGEWHDVAFFWMADAKRFMVNLDNKLIINEILDIVNDMLEGEQFVYWGFTATTGVLSNLQQVELGDINVQQRSNTLPVISEISDVIICKEETEASLVEFSVIDDDSNYEQITYSISSSNAQFIADTCITIVRNDSIKILSVKPVNKDTGETVITLIVTDADGASTSETFMIKIIDCDTDGDGVTNDIDAFPNDSTEWLDTDHDGIGNNADTDDDGDAYSDIDELDNQTDPLDPYCTPVDCDGDGISDLKDDDDDGDGYSDLDEIENNTDPVDDKSTPLDNDGDGISDINDPDDDNDGIPDDEDHTPLGVATNLNKNMQKCIVNHVVGTGVVNIKCSAPFAYTVHDLSGKLIVAKANCLNNSSVNLEDQKSGMYIITFTVDSKVINTSKIILH